MKYDLNNTFKKVFIGGIQFKNRIIRSATHEGLGDSNGFPTEKLIKKYISLAKGGVGGIITGYSGINQSGKSPNHCMLMIDSDEAIPKYKKVTEAVHNYGTPIILQIAHCGSQTRTKVTKYPTYAPSSIKHKIYFEDKPRELSEIEINKIINDFVNAIIRAKKSGFDGVQLHMAHGYLLSEFLSNYRNRRHDIWGGSTENKFKIVEKIFTNARKEVGDFPIFAKINAFDRQKNGMRIEESIQIAKLLQNCGCAGIEISSGTTEDGLYTVRGNELPIDALIRNSFLFKKTPTFFNGIVKTLLKIMIKTPRETSMYNLKSAVQIKKEVEIPIILVGGISNIDDINLIINKKIDLVSMSRPFIIEPGIVNKFKESNQRSSKCLKCNICLFAGENKPLKCYYGKF